MRIRSNVCAGLSNFKCKDGGKGGTFTFDKNDSKKLKKCKPNS